MMQSENACPIHEAFARYNDAAMKMRSFNPVYQKALAKNLATSQMLERKSALAKELRESFRELRTALFLAGALDAEKWNDQQAVLQAANAHC
jgi:hypothetical protein